mgnify:CR=1 FL=1
MDYKKVLRLHFVNHLSCREIAESCGDCSKTTVNEFLKRFRENPVLSYPLPADVTNEYIGNMLYKKPGVSADRLLYRDFNKEAVYKALARKGETLKCILRSPADTDAFQSGRCAEHKGRPETLAIIN